jgi:hypothetical protein
MSPLFLDPDSYHFGSKWGAAEFSTFYTIINRGLNRTENGQFAPSTSAEIIRDLKAAGISYRRTNMLEDLARMKMTEYSKDIISYRKAQGFADTVKRYKELYGITTYGEAAQKVHEWTSYSFATLEDAERAQELSLEGYEPSPNLWGDNDPYTDEQEAQPNLFLPLIPDAEWE